MRWAGGQPLDNSPGFRYNKIRMIDDITPFLPLSPASLHILLSLAPEDRHGYGIMQEVARQSEGQYKLGPGTLYDNLQKLLTQSLVGESTRSFPHEDPRRRSTLHQNPKTPRKGVWGGTPPPPPPGGAPPPLFPPLFFCRPRGGGGG